MVASREYLLVNIVSQAVLSEKAESIILTNRNHYPPNWPELSKAAKERAGWKCEHCGVEQFTMAMSAKGNPYIVYLAACHVNHDQGNPNPELVALCVRCHSKMDYEHRQAEARIRLEQLKHLRLLIEQGMVEVRVNLRPESIEQRAQAGFEIDY